ncbi:MAG: amidase [Solirubrobacteraceae bacterium]|nr:amidase [Solirubrobacteraceae bacterium]
MSVATDAFAQALGTLAAQPQEPPDRPPAYDVFGAKQAQGATGTTLADLPATGRIAALTSALRAGKTTSERLVREALDLIAAENDELTAFVEVHAAEALAVAAERDTQLATGTVLGPLHGLPISVKDVIDVGGMTTRCGSDAYEEHPADDAAAVALLRAAGAIVLGKTATHEFALGVTSPQSRNPHDRTRIPGGSSGGSAVAVTTGMSVVSLGTDTRASIRVPAALCGIVGMRPTYGTSPTAGMVPLSWTMDTTALLAPTVADVAVAMDVIRPTVDPVAGAVDAPVDTLRVGIPRAAWEDVTPVVDAAVEGALARLAGLVADVGELRRPDAADFAAGNALGLIVSRSEAAAFHRAAGLDRSRYWDEVRDQLDAADGVLAIDYIDAQRSRAALHDEMRGVFELADVLAMPTTPVQAPPAEDAEDYLTVLSRNAILWSFVGFPAISIPCPVPDGELPVGLQLVAAPGGEATLIALAAALTS